MKIIVGAAADSLKTLEPNPPFDFVFIDADSQSVVTYYKEAKRLTKSGGVIVSLSRFSGRVMLTCRLRRYDATIDRGQRE